MDHSQAVTTHASERYLLEEMADVERDAFEEHYFSCANCADDVRAGGLMRAGAQMGYTRSTIQSARGWHEVLAFPVKRVWRASVVLPWAAAAVLALTTGYQSMFVVPGLRGQLSSQALTPVTLRPASRGAETAVTRPTRDPLTLALDTNLVAAAAALTYDLRTIGGTSVATGAAPAPPPGTPLLLLVPASAIESIGSYVLTIRPGEGAGQPIEYRFTVTEP